MGSQPDSPSEGLQFWRRLKPVTQRRIGWACIIFVLLSLIGVSLLVFADAYSLVEGGKRCAPSLTKSQWPEFLGCAMSAHEGLSAGIIGAAGALFAAWLAFDAIQEQLAHQKSQLLLRQAEAKAVATVVVATSIQAAATALAELDKAIAAKSDIYQNAADQALSVATSYVETALGDPEGTVPVGERLAEVTLDGKRYAPSVVSQSELFGWWSIA
jgi:hypothetical protein